MFPLHSEPTQKVTVTPGSHMGDGNYPQIQASYLIRNVQLEERSLLKTKYFIGPSYLQRKPYKVEIFFSATKSSFKIKGAGFHLSQLWKSNKH